MSGASVTQLKRGLFWAVWRSEGALTYGFITRYAELEVRWLRADQCSQLAKFWTKVRLSVGVS